MVRLGLAVPLDLQDLETHPDGVAVGIVVGSGEVADNAVPAHLGLVDDGLGHRHGRVPVHLDEAVKIEDLPGPRRLGGGLEPGRDGEHHQDGDDLQNSGRSR